MPIHPAIKSLLRQISIIENISFIDLLNLISLHRHGNMSLNVLIASFCAVYFAQSATFYGHRFAQHGRGISSIMSVFPCLINSNEKVTSVISDNSFLLSEDRARYNIKE